MLALPNMQTLTFLELEKKHTSYHTYKHAHTAVPYHYSLTMFAGTRVAAYDMLV